MIAISCNGCGTVLAEDGCPNRACLNWRGLKAPKKPAVRLVGLHSDDDVPSEYIELECFKDGALNAPIHADWCATTTPARVGEFRCNCGAGEACPRCGTTEPRQIVDRYSGDAPFVCFGSSRCDSVYERRNRTAPAPTILESARKIAALIAAKNEVLYQACGDIDAGAVAIVCEHGRIKQHGTPCGYKRRR